MVGPGPAGYRPVGPPSGPQLKPVADSTYFTAASPALRVVSDCWVIVPGVRATRSDLAIRKAVAEEIVPLIAALSAGERRNPHRVQVWGVDDGKQGSSFSEAVKIAYYAKEDLPAEKLAVAQARVASLHKNSKLAVASEIFYRGVEYSDFAAGPLTSASSILAFYQVLEACADVVPWMTPADYDEKSAAIAATLKKTLEGKALAKKKAKAIRASNDALNRLDAKYTSLRIEHTASTFGLEKHWIERSRELGKFRNSRLSHPSALPSPSEMNEWEAQNNEWSAYALASTILAAAFHYVAEETTA